MLPHPPPPRPRSLRLFSFTTPSGNEAKPCFEFSAIFLSASSFAVIILSSILDTFTQRIRESFQICPSFLRENAPTPPPPPRPRSLRLFFFYDTEWQRDEADSLLDFRYFYTTFIFKRVFWLTRTITRSRGFAPSSYTFALFSRTKPRFQVRRNSKLVYSTFCNFSHQS